VKGIVPSTKPSAPTYSKIFGDWICDMSEKDDRVVAITPAMREGSGLVEYEQRFPNRYFDVGIAEQHSVTVAAGMACDGLKPVVAIYSTFLQRAYDQLIHDVVVQNLPVLFAIDRAGCVGADGPTHNGTFDISFMRCLPNMVIMTPADENECRQMLYTGIKHDGPASVRYPRGGGPGVDVEMEMTEIPLGKAEIKTQGKKIAILAFGVVLDFAQAAGESLGATVVNMRFVKPVDEELILKMAATHDLLVTVEENVIQGGAGEAVNQVLAENGVVQACVNYGLPDRLIQHGSREDMLNDVGMNEEGLLEFIQHHLGEAGKSARIKSV
jgi:1-deoxy-D-xylulose-5-phosphate synthase